MGDSGLIVWVMRPMVYLESISPRKSHWLVHVIAVWPLLMLGAGIASMEGGKAHTLSLPFSSLTYMTPPACDCLLFHGGSDSQSAIWRIRVVLCIRVGNVNQLHTSADCVEVRRVDSGCAVADSARNERYGGPVPTPLRALLVFR